MVQSWMIYKHVVVARAVLKTIRDEVRRSRWTETGGPLAGSVTEDGALLVTHAAAPGKRGRRERFSVLIDGESAQEFCDALYRESGGKLDYVGDWHTHLGWSLTPSKRDVAAMQEMAAFEFCPVRNPVSLIYRSLPEKFLVYVLNSKGEFEPIPSKLRF